MSPLKTRRRRLVLVLCIAVVTIGVVSARPWRAAQPECPIDVRPGESIQAAIDFAEAGVVICLDEGAWVENISIDKPLTIMGMGAERTFIEAARGLEPVVVVSSQNTEGIDVTIIGVTIHGLGGGSGVSISGVAAAEVRDCALSGRLVAIEATDSADLTINNCTILDHRQRGITLADEAKASINNSRISGNLGPGLWISHSAEVALFDCEISDNRSHGFRVQHEGRVTLNNCSVSSNQGCGLWLTDGSTAHVGQSRISANADQGIKAQDLAMLDVSESDLLSNWHGIELAHQAHGTIAGSTVSMNRWDGMRIQHYTQAIISSSVITINGRGVWVTGQANADISECLIEENSGYGILSLSKGEVVGQDNKLRENGVDLGGNLAASLRAPLKEPSETTINWPDERYASLQEAIDALLPGGTLLLSQGTYMGGLTIGKELLVEGDYGQAVLIAKSDALPVLSLVDGADLHLVRATLSGGSSGLLVSASARAVMAECTISGNTDGVNLSFSSSAEMTDCTIENNERNGISIGDSAQSTIIRCSVYGNRGYGVALADSARATITETTIAQSGGEGGVVLRGSCQVLLEGNAIVNNRGYGVTIVEHPCFLGSPWIFYGRISGKSNSFSGNWHGDVCPPELGFLSTVEGGALDRISSSSY